MINNRRRAVNLVQTPDEKLHLIPLEPFFESEKYNGVTPDLCKIITQEKDLGFWVYEKTRVGGSFDGISDEIIVREITEEDVKRIKKINKCYIEVDHNNKLRTAKNGLGHQKVVIHTVIKN